MARSSSAGKAGADAVLNTPIHRDSTGGVLAYVLLATQALLFLFMTAAMVSHSPGDWPGISVFPHNDPAHNWCGPFGAWPAHMAFKTLGWGAWVLLALWGLFIFIRAFVGKVGHTPIRVVGAIIMAAGVSAAQAHVFPGTGPIADLPGGTLGVVGQEELLARFGSFGTMLVIALVFLIGATVTLDVWVVIAPLWAYKKIKAVTPPVVEATSVAAGHTAVAGKAAAGWLGTMLARFKPAEPRTAPQVAAANSRRRKKAAQADGKSGTETKDIIDDKAGGLGGTESFDPNDHAAIETADGQVVPVAVEAKEPKSRKGKKAAAEQGDPLSDSDQAEEAESDGATADGASGDNEGDDQGEDQPKTFTPEELRAKIAKLPIRFAAQERKSATEADLRDIQNTSDLEGYKFPGLDLLEEPEPNYDQKLESFVREQATALERALKEYKIDGGVVGIESGPVITMYEVRLAPGTKVAALGAISSDLARALRAVNIRIVPNTEGRDTVGVEVPNPHKEKVRLKELMGRSDKWTGMNLPMFLGKDASGSPLIVDLTSMPHMLIAGTTGSGKSVCMSSILMSFLYTKKPNELKLVLVDPKMVELSQFKDVPHLMCPVVTEMGKAAAILEWAVRKMDERYELLAEAGCRDIGGYNNLTWEELKERFNPKDETEAARIPKKLPFMVFVIDELADLMMTNKEVEHSIVRIAQKARAVGMHLIVATQRPQANVVTGLIKSNMPARIAFKVASGMDSRIVLDQKGGELLLGQGDMLFLSPRTSKLARSQGTLVDDREIRKVVKFLKEVAEPTFERSLMQIKTGSAAGLPGDNDEHIDGGLEGVAVAQSDPLFDKAVDAVLGAKTGSVSLLQRRFAIGYTRASKLIEAMGHAGILGPHVGTQAREVQMTLEEWQAIKAQAQADAAGGLFDPAAAEAAKAAAKADDEALGEFASESDDEGGSGKGRRAESGPSDPGSSGDSGAGMTVVTAGRSRIGQ
ncbi:MAG: DNA translocase FtsK 4TM domain-containing protein [Phycisphaerales bacterium]|jgi:S-DNA-T family DNA segregation ATPase FtsK/SpoIIIE|nr:DNA translocase FtsK [Phycisphaeraceae bacterium]